MNEDTKTQPQSSDGHRKRLRERFLSSGLNGFHDYEIVELLLTLGSPRKDCKQPAKEAIKRFGSLRGVLEASAEELQQIPNIGPSNSFGIKLATEVAERFLKEKIVEKPICSSAEQVFDYLYCSMRGLKKEVFKAIFLDSQNRIINVSDISQGTVNSNNVPIREVMEKALGNNAASIIYVHNHPSGGVKPSKQDKELTRDLVFASTLLKIKTLDHVIIGDNTYFSFAAEGLISDYETDFVSLRVKGVSEARRTLYKAKLFGGLSE